MALAQFRDNVLVASAGPHAATAMRDVCDTLSDVRHLPMCPCLRKPRDTCT